MGETKAPSWTEEYDSTTVHGAHWPVPADWTLHTVEDGALWRRVRHYGEDAERWRELTSELDEELAMVRAEDAMLLDELLELDARNDIERHRWTLKIDGEEVFVVEDPEWQALLERVAAALQAFSEEEVADS